MEKSERKYYNVSLSNDLRECIDNLFSDQTKVQKMYDNNKVKFIDDAVRRLIVFWDSLYGEKKTV